MTYQKVYMNQIHSSSLLGQLSLLWKNDILCDAVLSAGTVKVKAHRIVLVAACPMLQSKDAAGHGSQLEVKLSSEIDQQSVITFLQYLYEGFMMLTQESAPEVERIARLLQVDCVIKCCLDFYKAVEQETGHVISGDSMFSFGVDSADFKYVRSSEMLVSADQESDRQALDREESLVQKKCIGTSEMGNMTQNDSSGGDNFVMIQTDPQGVTSVQTSQSSSVGITTKVNTAGNQSTQVVDMEKTSAGTSSLYPGYQESRANIAETASVVGQSLKRKQAVSSYVPSPVNKRHQTISHYPLNTNYALPSNSNSVMKHPVSKLHSNQNGDFNECLGNQSLAPAMYPSFDMSSVQGRSSTLRPEEATDNVAPDLSIVKRECTEIDSAMGDDVSAGNEGEDDTCDMQADLSPYTDDGHPSPAPDGQAFFHWYSNTNKDRGKLEDTLPTYTNAQRKDKEDLMKARASPSQSRLRRFSYPTPLSFKHHMSARQKVVRALSMLKAPFVFLRPLQRKLNCIKVEDLKAVCQALSEEGFGHFVLKHQSNILQRDTFFKASPQLILEDNPILRDSQVSHNLYVHNFNDISEITEEEMKLMYAAHPEKDYVQKLCEGLVNKDDKEVRSLEAAAGMPRFSVPFYGVSNHSVLSPKSVQSLGSTGNSVNGHFVDTPSAPTAEEFRLMLSTPLAYEGQLDVRKRSTDVVNSSEKVNSPVSKENIEIVKKEY